MNDTSPPPNGTAPGDKANLLADWIPRERLAAILGLTCDTLARWAARREGPPCTRIGRKTFYRSAAVLDWIRAQEQAMPQRKSRGRT
jgi:phage terminase Nu1 subunit (DNA packaging protein)